MLMVRKYLSFIIVIIIICVLQAQGQVYSSHTLSEVSAPEPDKFVTDNQIMGTCASPDGNMNSTSAPPASYAALQTGGYCNPNNYGGSGTVCWVFTPTGNSVSINSGYSTSGCTNACGLSFGSFNLYTCAPACVLVSTGLNHTVNPGQCYTWCMNYTKTGGGCPAACHFNDFCPYYQQTTILPVDLIYFAGANIDNLNVFEWKTATELNNDFFVLETSENALDWTEAA